MNSKIKLSYIMFVLANAFCKGIGLNNTSSVYKIIMIIGVLGVLWTISLQKYTRKQTVLMAAMLLAGAVTLLTARQYTFLITCITAIGIKNIDVNRLIKNICSVRTVCFIITFTLAMCNVIDPDRRLITRDTEELTRYGMGYGHPNTLHLTLFIVLTLNYYCSIKNRSATKKFWLAAVALNLFIYTYSRSRTGFIVICIFAILIVLCHIELPKKFVVYLPAVVFGTLMALTFLTPWFYEVGLLNDLTMLNGRVAYTNSYLTQYGYSLFGISESILDDAGLILDNGYLRLLIETGVVGLLIWVYLNINVMKRILNNADTKMAVIVTCFYVYIFTESFSANIFMNYILFWGADEIFNKNRTEGLIDGNDFHPNI